MEGAFPVSSSGDTRRTARGEYNASKCLQEKRLEERGDIGSAVVQTISRVFATAAARDWTVKT
jgi:hypothetical protein